MYSVTSLNLLILGICRVMFLQTIWGVFYIDNDVCGLEQFYFFLPNLSPSAHFLILPCLIALVKYEYSIVVVGVDNCFSPILKRKNVVFLQLIMMLTIGFCTMHFIKAKKDPPVSSLLRIFFFNHKSILNFVKCFICISWYYKVVFFRLIMQWVTEWISNTELALHSLLALVQYSFYILLNLICWYYAEDFWHLCSWNRGL